MRVDEVLDLEIDEAGVPARQRLTAAGIDDVKALQDLAKPSVIDALHADFLFLLKKHREPRVGETFGVFATDFGSLGVAKALPGFCKQLLTRRQLDRKPRLGLLQVLRPQRALVGPA